MLTTLKKWGGGGGGGGHTGFGLSRHPFKIHLCYDFEISYMDSSLINV